MTDPAYFEDLYRTDPDPWRLDTAPYEECKRAQTLASLPRPRYARAFEPACARGQITALLAERCDELVALDPVEAALERVRGRDLAGVSVRRGTIPDDWPAGTFDLVVLSEVLYFLTAEQRARCAELTVASLRPGGHVVAVHWRHSFTEAASVPDEAHVDLHTSALRPVSGYLDDDVRLEVLERA